MACDQLTPFARWITPNSFSRRFDALFYLVKTPIDYIASHDRVESVGSVWTTPSEALKNADEGRITLVFATRMNLQKLGKYNDVASSINAAKKLYRSLSEHFNNNVPQFYFTVQKGSSGKGKYYHFKVTEKKAKPKETRIEKLKITVRELTKEDVEKITGANACSLFKIT